ncbi:hypothetical protein P171DRAFT_428329 [Karstenula rhodostoma CBS 690.94]|uniref:Uncharacterized protein n=1 Tax=Karstenula rhodostoma CBS 690.94 TaxID=1392251 RepID=A0A9P4UDU7_9PLEO|nr:hypothetical protein P171DRAFT_428329 [Karstenula rhodostoma CBS 690.94]
MSARPMRPRHEVIRRHTRPPVTFPLAVPISRPADPAPASPIRSPNAHPPNACRSIQGRRAQSRYV